MSKRKITGPVCRSSYSDGKSITFRCDGSSDIPKWGDAKTEDDEVFFRDDDRFYTFTEEKTTCKACQSVTFKIIIEDEYRLVWDGVVFGMEAGKQNKPLPPHPNWTIPAFYMRATAERELQYLKQKYRTPKSMRIVASCF